MKAQWYICYKKHHKWTHKWNNMTKYFVNSISNLASPRLVNNSTPPPPPTQKKTLSLFSARGQRGSGLSREVFCGFVINSQKVLVIYYIVFVGVVYRRIRHRIGVNMLTYLEEVPHSLVIRTARVRIRPGDGYILNYSWILCYLWIYVYIHELLQLFLLRFLVPWVPSVYFHVMVLFIFCAHFTWGFDTVPQFTATHLYLAQHPPPSTPTHPFFPHTTILLRIQSNSWRKICQFSIRHTLYQRKKGVTLNAQNGRYNGKIRHTINRKFNNLIIINIFSIRLEYMEWERASERREIQRTERDRERQRDRDRDSAER